MLEFLAITYTFYKVMAVIFPPPPPDCYLYREISKTEQLAIPVICTDYIKAGN
jgi:hypothetical protein